MRRAAVCSYMDYPFFVEIQVVRLYMINGLI